MATRQTAQAARPPITAAPPTETLELIAAIASSAYMANEDQVEELASEVAQGQRADGTYLRVILAHTQTELKKLRRPAKGASEGETATHLLDGVHSALYPAVLRGVAPEDADLAERNRRATFARTAASTVRLFLRLGGDLRALDVGQATKGSLRRAVAPKLPSGTRTEQGFRRARDALLRGATKLMQKQPEQARQEIEQMIDALNELLGDNEAQPMSGVMVPERRPRAPREQRA